LIKTESNFLNKNYRFNEEEEEEVDTSEPTIVYAMDKMVASNGADDNVV
jgi:hypothetical protein